MRLARAAGRTKMKIAQATIATFALAFSLSAAAHAQAVEKKQVTLAVGGKTALYYLPLTICERLGYFKEQGLDVTTDDSLGAAQSLAALVTESLPVNTGASEETTPHQAKSKDTKAVIQIWCFNAMVSGVRNDQAAVSNAAAGPKAMEAGVSATS